MGARLRYPVNSCPAVALHPQDKETKKQKALAAPAMAQEEEVLGKAYDSRLMRRLLTYLRPYRWQVAIALVSIIFKSFADVLGPYLTKVEIDRYRAPAKGVPSGVWRWLSPQPLHGIAQIATIFFALLLLSFVLEFR